MQFRNFPSPVAFHAVARTNYPHRPFTDRNHCAEAWNRLRRLFPRCYAAVLMADHVHLILENTGIDADGLRLRLQHVFHGPHWERIPTPRAVPNRQHLRTQVRYVHLNPSRKHLGLDPLSWEWSTHRDYMGAVAAPWPRLSLALALLDFSDSPEGQEKFHKYVSADPSVHPLGSLPPWAPNPRPALLDLKACESAAEMVHRASTGYFRKRSPLRAELFSLLREDLRVPVTTVAEHFDVHWTAVRPRPWGERTPWTAPLLRVLADQRLRLPWQNHV